MKIGNLDLSQLDRRWIFVVPAAVLVILFVWASLPTTGEQVLLRTAPVDPPDLFRGDYVDMRYDITEVDNFRSIRGPARDGQTVYLYLAERGDWDADRDERFWVVDSWSTQREPEQERTYACIKGSVMSVGDRTMRVQFGIEQYFIQKDENLEDWRDAEVAMVVGLRDCQARIISAHVNGERWP